MKNITFAKINQPNYFKMKKLFFTSTMLATLLFLSCDKEEMPLEQNSIATNNNETVEYLEDINESKLIYVGREIVVSNPDQNLKDGFSGKATNVNSDWYELNRDVINRLRDENNKTSFGNLDFLKNRFASVTGNRSRPKAIRIGNIKYGKTGKAGGGTPSVKYRSVGPISNSKTVRGGYIRVKEVSPIIRKNYDNRTKSISAPKITWKIGSSTTKSNRISKTRSYKLGGDITVNDAFGITTEVTHATTIETSNGSTTSQSATYTPVQSIRLKPGQEGRWSLVKRKIQQVSSWDARMEFSGRVIGVYALQGFLRPRDKTESTFATKFFYEYTDRSRNKRQNLELITDEYYEYFIEATPL